MIRRYAGSSTPYRTNDLFGTKGATACSEDYGQSQGRGEHLHPAPPMLTQILEQVAKASLFDGCFISVVIIFFLFLSSLNFELSLCPAEQLKDTAYPFLGRSVADRCNTHTRTDIDTEHRHTQTQTHTIAQSVFTHIARLFRPQDVIVFICGGCTYEESRAVALFNEANPCGGILL